MCDKGQDPLIFFAFLLNGKLSVLKFNLCESCHNQCFRISSVDKLGFAKKVGFYQTR